MNAIQCWTTTTQAVKNPFSKIIWGLSLCGLCISVNAVELEPYGSNNTLYPSASEWRYGFRAANFDYPRAPIKKTWRDTVNAKVPEGPLTLETAPAYAQAFKQWLAENRIDDLVNNPIPWTTRAPEGSDGADWYDMPWQAHGKRLASGKIDPESGREALQGSFTGQILPPEMFDPRPPMSFQNHAVIYYNDVAALTLRQIWQDPFQPNFKALPYPDGSVTIKVEGAAISPNDWPPVRNSSLSYVYRPTTASLLDKGGDRTEAKVIPMYFSQITIRIKDSIASPQIGWVFMSLAYKADDKGETVWDRAVPLGVMWGNDPEYNKYPTGLPPVKKGEPPAKLKETWINPDAPEYAKKVLGWGGRLAGPMDVGQRHNVVTVSGKRYGIEQDFPASSCVSCHSPAQYPFIANLYPSPNIKFPMDGQTFLLYDPGTWDWSRWFQNRPGNVALSDDPNFGGIGDPEITRIYPLDYDMLLTFAAQEATFTTGTSMRLLMPRGGH